MEAQTSAPAPASETKKTKRASKKAPKAEAPEEKTITKKEAKGALPGLAKEINYRMEQAEKLLDKADDHRLAAAIKMAEAETDCKAAGVSFKDWAAKNLTFGWENARKLLSVGKAPEPAKALEDLREKVKAAQAKHRKKKQAEASATKTTTHKPATAIDALKLAFLDLKASEKVAFAEWVAQEIGGQLVTEFDKSQAREPVSTGPVGVAADDGSDIPPHLRAPRRRRRAAPENTEENAKAA